MEHNESSAKRKTHSSEYLKKKLERAYTNSLTAQLKALEQKEANTLKRSRWQEIIKVRAEINQVFELFKESTKPGAGSLKKTSKIHQNLSQTNQRAQRQYPNQQNQK